MQLDQGVVGSIFTVLVFVIFIGVVVYTFSKRNKKRFEDAANLVFDDENPTPTVDQSQNNKRES